MSNLAKTMDTIADLHKSHGVKQKGGKLYTQVVHRMEAFRRIHGTDFGLDTEILVNDGKRVVVKAIITDKDNRKVGAGMAEEIRGQGMVNTTSALENAETSAIGRALASLGLAGGEYASANEMDAVVRKTEAIKEKPKPVKKPKIELKDLPPKEIKIPKITPEERRERHEAKVPDFEHWCQQKRTKDQLDAYYTDSQSTLDEMKEHNPDLYKKAIQIFVKYLNEFERKTNG
tara:strand:+ start:514 stop:1206 length:693 start_codon:yes stop_codon:yes gene_type:complete